MSKTRQKTTKSAPTQDHPATGPAEPVATVQAEVHNRGGKPGITNEPAPAKGKAKDPATEQAEPELTVDQLKTRAEASYKKYQRLSRSILKGSTEGAETLFDFGQDMLALRSRVPKNEWMSYRIKRDMSPTTINQAIRFYKNAGSKERIKGMRVTDAKIQFGVIRDPKAKPVKPPTPAQLVKRLERLRDSFEDCLGTLSTMLAPGGLGDTKPEAVAKILRSLSDQSQQVSEALAKLEVQAPEAEPEAK
jgi:hypothetical protein